MAFQKDDHASIGIYAGIECSQRHWCTESVMAVVNHAMWMARRLAHEVGFRLLLQAFTARGLCLAVDECVQAGANQHQRHQYSGTGGQP